MAKEEGNVQLNDEAVARINDWREQGWTIEKKETGWFAEKQFDSDDERDNSPQTFENVDSLDALFAAIKSEEEMFAAWKAEQIEDSESVVKPDEAEKPKYVFENCRVILTENDIRNRTSERNSPA